MCESTPIWQMRKLSFRLSGRAHTGHLGSQVLTRAALYCSIGMRHCLVTRDITPKGFNHQVAHLLWGRELGESESHFVLKTYILQHVYMHHYNPSCRQGATGSPVQFISVAQLCLTLCDSLSRELYKCFPLTAQAGILGACYDSDLCFSRL